MPTAPKRFGQSDKPPRKAWQHSGPDRRAGFRGRNRQQAKRRIADRDGWQCVKCGKLVDLADSILDHVAPVAAGGTHDDDNLQTLCLKCSRDKTQQEAAQGRRRAGGL